MNFPGCATGAFVNGPENLSNFQQKIGKKLAVVLWYIHWLDPFPNKEADIVYANGSVPLITWEPWITHKLGALDAIATGCYEDYVKRFIQAAKDWGKPIFLRFAHEMNGNWYPWDGEHNGQFLGSKKYKEVWIYLYNVRSELKADNIKLVWCVNNSSVPDTSWNKAAAYYPGDQYVDWIGMDGYNWGYRKWEDFDSVFGGVYKELVSLTQKPIMIGEFGSAAHGGSKAEWIADAFNKIKTKYPSVKVFCWFNIDKERDWRVDSSQKAEAAFCQEIKDRYFIEKML